MKRFLKMFFLLASFAVIMHKPWSIADVQVTPRWTKWVGNKAARLGFLKQLAVPVPSFYVLPVYTCQKYLQHRDETSRLNLARKLNPLLSALTQPGGPAPVFAVRSSARAEDSTQYSFAGQFLSFLHLSETDQIMDALYAVFQSGAALSLRHYPGKAAKQCNDMAVIVQCMIQPVFSGVLFTKNPMHSGDEMLIEYVAASGEQLMQGNVEPFRIRVDRQTRQPADLGPGGMLSEPVYQPLLSNLYQMAEKIETSFGEAQDIEWAIDHQQHLWILQSRAITATSPSAHIMKDRWGREFTSYFFSERFAAPISPMGWSLIGEIIERNAFRDPLWFLGQDRLAKEGHLTNLFSGYPAVRLLLFQKLYSVIPPRFISNDKKTELELNRLTVRWWRSLLRALPYLFSRLLCKNLDWLPFFHLHKWHVFDNICQKRLNAIDKELAGNLPYKAQLRLLTETIELSDAFLSLHRWSITFADLYYELLLKYIAFFIDKETSLDLTHKLLSGLDNNQTVLANQHLAYLAAELGAADAQARAWDDYFAKFGHRSESLDVSVPTWAENRQSIMAFVQQMKRSGNSSPAFLHLAQLEKKATEKLCYERIRSKVGGRLHAYLFKYLLTRAQNFTLLRENQRDLWHRILAKSRAALLQLAEQLLQQGCLNRPHDIFYLTRSELVDWQQEKCNFIERVSKRKTCYEKWSASAQQPSIPEAAPENIHILQGVAVSRGRIEGYAHLAGSYEEALSAKKDSILIARSIDPAWTPVFHLVSGLVLEVGGVLSHASILAREFGIPAITSVHGATRLIKQGDHVVVDGNTGTVLLDEDKS